MGTINCNGVTINYRTVGKGDDVVLIHGLGANRAFWHFNVLLPLGRKYRVTIYDLRGHGYSTMPSSGYTSADMAEDLHHLLNHIGIQKAHLIGHSLGGVIALHYAALYPKRVSSLIVADSRVRSIQPTHYARDWPNWITAKKRLEKIGLCVPEDEPESGIWLMEQLASPEWQQNRHKLKGSSLFVPFSKWGGGNSSAEKLLEMMRTTAAKQELTSLAGLTLDRLSTIRQPTLLMYGNNSPSMLSLIGLQQYLPNYRSIIIPEAGHFFPLSQPDLFITKVNRFLDLTGQRERRKHERFSHRFPVGLRENGSDSFPAGVMDVSSQGILLMSSKKLEVGCEIEVITTPDQDGHRIAAKGKIVRSVNKNNGDGYQFGIELILAGKKNLLWNNFLATKNRKIHLI